MAAVFLVFSLVGLCLAAAYLLLVRWALQYWQSLPPPAKSNSSHYPMVSILVPARNEASNIANCLRQLREQDYPADRIEVIVIDDHSTDGTADLVRGFPMPNLQLLSLSDALPEGIPANAYKKQALELGVHQAQGDFILTTDADCLPPPNWARSMVAQMEGNDWQAVAGTVLCPPEGGALQRFQALDFAGMMLMTAAGLRSGRFTLGNGASLGYRKAAFLAVEGYAGNYAHASGDDVFLLRKLAKRYPGQIGSLKQASAAVRTAPKPDWRSLMQQRLRWGTKNRRAAEGWAATLALGTAFLLSWWILLSLPMLLWAGLPGIGLFATLLAAKTVADYQLLSTAARFFGQPQALRLFWQSEALHIFYLAVVGLLALVRKQYVWKGRNVA